MQTLNKNEGLITQIIGPVIDVEFQQGELPEIYNALNITADDGTVIVAEVQHLIVDADTWSASGGGEVLDHGDHLRCRKRHREGIGNRVVLRDIVGTAIHLVNAKVHCK